RQALDAQPRAGDLLEEESPAPRPAASLGQRAVEDRLDELPRARFRAEARPRGEGPEEARRYSRAGPEMRRAGVAAPVARLYRTASLKDEPLPAPRGAVVLGSRAAAERLAHALLPGLARPARWGVDHRVVPHADR